MQIRFERLSQVAIPELVALIVLLPPSRTRTRALLRMGLHPDGEVQVGTERFLRYRLVNSAFLT